MTIDRRKLRKALGSRTQRRAGTKTKVIPGLQKSQGGPAPKYRYARRQRKRPRERIAEMIRSMRAEESP